MKKLCISILSLLLLCSCSSTDKSDESYVNAMRPSVANENYAYEEFDGESLFDSASGAAEERKNSSTTETFSRKLIYTYNYTLQTESYDEVVRSIKEAVNTAGGYIQSGDESGISYYYDSHNRYYMFVIRIPADRTNEFTTTISSLEGAVVTNSSENVQDVTSSYQDTEAHITNLKIEEDTLNNLMQRAESITDIITLEERISQVRYDIEYYQNQLKNMNTLIDYATYNITVDEVHRVEYEEQTLGEKIANEFYYTVVGVKQFFEGLIIFILGDSIWIIIWGAVIFGVYKLFKHLYGKHSFKKGNHKENAHLEEKVVDNTK